VRRLEQGVSIAEAARALEVNLNVLHRWLREFRKGPGNVFPGNGKPRWSEGRMAELERKVGQQTLEVDFLKGWLQSIEEQRMPAGADWKSAVYRKVQEEVEKDRGLPVADMVKPGGVSRASFYRNREPNAGTVDRDMDLRDAIQRIALEWPCYGRPRITTELKRQGSRTISKTAALRRRARSRSRSLVGSVWPTNSAASSTAAPGGFAPCLTNG